MYRIGRRFEYRVVYDLKKFGLDCKRVPLSGRANALIPNADIIVNNKKGKLKYSRREYVIFPKREFEELIKNEINFLCFGFYKTKEFFIVKNFENYETKIKKEFRNYISLNRNLIEKVPFNLILDNYVFDVITIEKFVKIIEKI